MSCNCHERKDKGIGSVLRWINSPRVSRETSDARLAVCRDCEFLTRAKICEKCGCVMPLKVTRKAAKCVIGKWS